MNHFQVKVCGITRTTDAELVADLGGDMVGFVFYTKSPRRISVRAAADISRSGAVALVDRVGVFVDERVARILRIAERVRLDLIQLHGNETAKEVAAIQKAGFRVIKAHRVSCSDDWERAARSRADLIMADRMTRELPGGSGKQFDWSIRPRRKLPNLVLAGGISVDNLAEGVKLFKPILVDVSSGVETRPGIKSSRKLRAFFAECNRLRYGS
ncbi:MAG: phosphoribosylanthranilate isomerase [Candidatus Zixiibacteriota bacterium]|nr:MAG: phosphoribosylanthranilate isomerase [candidate division Zixibacteria bacterium]